MTTIDKVFEPGEMAILPVQPEALRQLAGVKAAPVRDDELLTVAETAARLRCSKAHVCNIINGKVGGLTPLPTIRLGRRKLVRVAALRNWLAANEQGLMVS